MTTYFIDPEGGDDTKDGLSFANRLRSLKKFGNGTIVGARGDELRMMASRAPYSGGSAAWVDNTEFCTLASPTFSVVDLATSGWVGAGTTSATAIASVTSAQVMLDAATQLIMPGTTAIGKLAYKTLPATLDLSSWSAISMLICNGQQWPFGLKLCLCSDSTGDVPLKELTIEQFRSHKFPALLTDGTALPAGVNSLSLWATTAESHTFNILTFENIIAVKGVGESGHISHRCIISRNSSANPEWLPIRGFGTGGKVYIGAVRQGSGNTWPKWRGVSGSDTCLIMQPTMLTWLQRYESFWAAGHWEVDFTGGWSRTDMASQTGTTWLHGMQARMLSGGEGSSNPDLPSVADDPVRLFQRATGSFSINTPIFYTVKKFGFVEFSSWPVQQAMYLSAQYELDGIVGLSDALKPPSVFSVVNVDYVSYCRYGLFFPTADGTGDNQNSWYAQGRLEVNVKKITGTMFGNWFPPTNIGMSRIYNVGAIQNCTVGATNNSVQTLETGYTRLSNTSFRWNGTDLNCFFPFLAEGCSFLNDSTGAPRAPTVGFGNRIGLEARFTGVNGNAWDTRVIHKNGRTARVEEGIGRVPGRRTLHLSAALSNGDGRIPTPMREQIALVVAKAGIPTTVSAYLKQQSWYSPEHANVLQKQKTCICTVAGNTPGVGRVEGINIQKGNKWGRVVITFTSDVDALVPIYMESEIYEAWGTECGLDDSGIGPDPILPPTPPVLTDSITFVAAYEDFMGAYDVYEAGNTQAHDCLAGLGIDFTQMTSGTVTEATGKLIGSALLIEKGGSNVLAAYSVLSPGWENDGLMTALTVKLKEGDTELATFGPFNGTPIPASAPNTGCGIVGTTGVVYPAGLTVGHTYTVEFYRGEPD